MIQIRRSKPLNFELTNRTTTDLQPNMGHGLYQERQRECLDERSVQMRQLLFMLFRHFSFRSLSGIDSNSFVSNNYIVAF